MKKYMTLGVMATMAISAFASIPVLAQDHLDRANRDQFRADRQEMKSQRDAMVGDEYGAVKHAMHANRDQHRAYRNERKFVRDGY
jgi:hypothetical protein